MMKDDPARPATPEDILSTEASAPPSILTQGRDLACSVGVPATDKPSLE